MKHIVHIASLIKSLGPAAPGGAEQGVILLAQEQVRRGYRVSIIACEGSIVPEEVNLINLKIPPDRLVPIETSKLSSDTTYTESEKLRRLAEEILIFSPVHDYLRKNSDKINLCHNHAYDFFPLFELNTCNLPLVHTLHLPPIIPWINQALTVKNLYSSSETYLTVSKTSRAIYQEICKIKLEAVHYGIEVNSIPFNPIPEEHFLWVGRISPEKGLHTALESVVYTAKKRLKIVGRVYDQEYYRLQILPLLENPLVEYLGFLPRSDVIKEMALAQALIFPIEWDEPFGLVMVEALACGTPVIAYPRGAAIEIVEDQKNGFLVQDQHSLSQSLADVSLLSRKACRKGVEQRFSVAKMADEYFKIYQQVS